jgi:hypothetical protein
MLTTLFLTLTLLTHRPPPQSPVEGTPAAYDRTGVALMTFEPSAGPNTLETLRELGWQSPAEGTHVVRLPSGTWLVSATWKGRMTEGRLTRLAQQVPKLRSCQPDAPLSKPVDKTPEFRLHPE